ncbi:MAG: endonuclease/exonuclease/phosphatase family protein, partial [Acetobacteraceae bacterium]
LALLSELDCGMLRTGQRHVTAELAEHLGQQYAYGLEFLELAAMSPPGPPPGEAPNGAENARGFHGNAIVTALDLRDPALIRLDEVGDWFVAPWKGQRRIGNRMALAGTVSVGGFRFLACAVHLENLTDGPGRAAQMHTLLDALDGLADGLPVLVGGDLNTRVEPGRHDDPAEPLFALAGRRGYTVAGCNRSGRTTRDSVWNQRDSFPQLDWFLARGLRVSDPEIVPAQAPDGTVLSDHELILVSIAPLA